MKCPDCKSDDVEPVELAGEQQPDYICNSCGAVFDSMDAED